MVMRIDITSRDLRSTINSLGLLDSDLRRVTNEDTRRVTNFMSRRAKLFAPVKKGDLKASIAVRSEGRGLWRMFTGQGLTRPYDVYQEIGFKHWLTGEHIQNPYAGPAVRDGAIFLDNILRKDMSTVTRRFSR